MHSSGTFLIVVGVFLVAGALLVSTANSPDSFGWFAVAPESDSIVVPDSFTILTTREVLGFAAGWIASLILTGLVVRHFVTRRFTPNGDR